MHICRVKPYRDAAVGESVEMRAVAEFSDRIWHTVEKVKDLRLSHGSFDVLVAWKGLSTSGDTWEPLSTMYEDVPTKVRDFFAKKRASDLIKRAKDSISL